MSLEKGAWPAKDQERAVRTVGFRVSGWAFRDLGLGCRAWRLVLFGANPLLR